MKDQSAYENGRPVERHYAVDEVADMWHLSPDKVRDLFEHEPGVLVIGDPSPSSQKAVPHTSYPQMVYRPRSHATGR